MWSQRQNLDQYRFNYVKKTTKLALSSIGFFLFCMGYINKSKNYLFTIGEWKFQANIASYNTFEENQGQFFARFGSKNGSKL